ncbi:MAG TPA: SDR family oxidoreductase [Gemmatimonadaceae bacterium]|jgi:NADP-dependent 3-hydroxy acid dehydrogenase YdfG|nr:SDR family oxidoreductase [Gemmatimonadaceae bacterium]
MTAVGAVPIRTAVVSGASRGIGFAIARALAERQVRVVMLARGERALRQAADAIGRQAAPLVCDVADPRAIDAMVELTQEQFGAAPDVLVNNAGVFRLSAVHETTVDEFAAALEVNLTAPFRLLRAFLPAMRDRRSGHIVSIGSIADRVAFAENAAYAAGKFGLRGLHEVLRAELANSGVRATLISPGPVDTSLWDPIDPDNRPGFSPRSAMLRADAVAQAVLYAVTQPADVSVDELRLSHS